MGNYMDDLDETQENKQPTIKIKNTRFIYKTNFSGDPKRDKYGNNKRHFNLVIPDAALAQDLIMDGFNVKTYYGKNKDGSTSGVPTFFVDVKINYDYSTPPSIYLLIPEEKKKILFDESTVGRLDYISAQNVEANLAVVKSKNSPDKKTLYVRQLYVTQFVDDDPFADEYADYQTELGAQGMPEKKDHDTPDGSEEIEPNNNSAYTDHSGGSDYFG